MSQPASGRPAAIRIDRYERRPARLHEWDPRTAEVARHVADLIHQRRPHLVVEHIGSTAVSDLPGKGIVDLSVEAPPADIPGITQLLYDLGFQPQPGPNPFPPTRPMLVGAMWLGGDEFRIHFHVQPTGGDLRRDLAFRDALRADPALAAEYAALKRGITAGDAVDALRYTYSKVAWVRGVLRDLGFSFPAVLPPATIGILGGGQLGRMFALAARELGYRISVLDPDPACPAASVADRFEIGRYDDIEAAKRMAAGCPVVTYELEHVAEEVVRALDDGSREIRPGIYPLLVSQDRLAERRFVEMVGAAVAPWREVRTGAELRAAATELGLPLRLKAAIGGYDGRSQVRIADDAGLEEAAASLATGDRPALVERELAFVEELSIIVAQGIDGASVTYPLARNVHDRGILVESAAPADVPAGVAESAVRLAKELATAMGLNGVLTVELFRMPDDSLVVNELAPRVHNSGHWTIEAAVTSQFEQHLRAICGLPLGSTALRGAAATVNLLGTGPERAARATGVERALGEPDVHVHLYDKRRVFERRKMGHVTAVAPTADEALRRARAAAAHVGWAEEG